MVVDCCVQMAEMKKKLDEALAAAESYEDAKKKTARDAEQLQDRISQLTADNDKVNKSRKKLESEVGDLTVELETQRALVQNLEKKQKKFDQSLAEEKAVSEKYAVVSLNVLF
jgi:myosin protein heavy chain